MNKVTENPAEALARIEAGFSKNDILVIQAFAERGVDPADITPRDNVLTFNAWKAKGRRVAKGATSVRVQTWIPVKGKEVETTKDGKRAMRPKLAFLFHVSQTVAGDAPRGTKPDAWCNPHLVKAGAYESDTNGIQTVDSESPSPISGTSVPESEEPMVPAEVVPEVPPAIVATALPMVTPAKPEPGKVYSLFAMAQGKPLNECEASL